KDGIRDLIVTGVQTCALPIYAPAFPQLRELHSDLLQLRESRRVKFGSWMDGRKLLSTAALKWVAAAAVLIMALLASLYLVRGRRDRKSVVQGRIVGRHSSETD